MEFSGTWQNIVEFSKTWRNMAEYSRLPFCGWSLVAKLVKIGGYV